MRWTVPAIFTVACVAHASPLNVTIDPGHGGHDHGASRQGVYESDITLAVAKRLTELLRKDKRFTTQLSRDNDQTVTLYRRAVNAKTRKSDVFLSIHVNSNPDTRARGAEFYFQNQLPPDEESMFLAHKENT